MTIISRATAHNCPSPAAPADVPSAAAASIVAPTVNSASDDEDICKIIEPSTGKTEISDIIAFRNPIGCKRTDHALRDQYHEKKLEDGRSDFSCVSCVTAGSAVKKVYVSRHFSFVNAHVYQNCNVCVSYC